MNYRVCQYRDGDQVLFAVCEVWYDKNDKPTSTSTVRLSSYTSADAIQEVVRRVNRALDWPILDLTNEDVPR